MSTIAQMVLYDLATNRPAASIAGRVFYASDTKAISRDNGSSWDDVTPSASSGLVKISEQILGAPASTVTFSTIAGTYRNLRLTINARSDAAGAALVDCYMQFNGDTGTNYSRLYVLGNNGSASSGSVFSAAQVPAFTIPQASALANAAGTAIITIFNYAATIFSKIANSSVNATSALSSAGTIDVNETFLWSSTSAITDIVLGLTTAGNFVTGSTFTLYGEA